MSEENKKGAGAGAASASTEEQIATLQKQVAEQQNEIVKLQGAVSEKKEAPKSSVASAEEAKKEAEEEKVKAKYEKTFKLDGVEHEFKIHRFKFEGKSWTASEVMALEKDEAKLILAKLKDQKSGVIGPVKGGK